MPEQPNQSGSSPLRKRAEQVLQGQPVEIEDLSPQAVQELVHELQVHQIELTLQNEELQESQQQLAAARDRYASLYERAPVGYFTLDEEGHILQANRTAATLLEVDHSTLGGQRLTRFIAREYQDTYHFYWRALVRTDQPQRCEVALVRGDESTKYVRLESIMVPDPPGDLPRYRTVMSDVTERKRVEAALRQRTAELEQRNQELDAFARTVAHDLDNPLALMVGFADLLKEDRDQLTDAEQDRYLERIVRAGHRMSRIIESLLLLANVRQSSDLETQPVDMGIIVDEVLAHLSEMIGAYQAQVITPETWPVAWGFAPWLEQVWFNYISNAIKYGGRPPRVTLGAAEQADGQVRFWVRDDGQGLSPQEQEQLFQPFTRLAPGEKQGHGLGLSIVQRIVARLGGQVGVESEPGQGSIFYFTLPADEDVSAESL
jgi:PAS domain S-box-containing protein